MKCVKISYKLTELKVKVLKFIICVFFIYNSFRNNRSTFLFNRNCIYSNPDTILTLTLIMIMIMILTLLLILILTLIPNIAWPWFRSRLDPDYYPSHNWKLQRICLANPPSPYLWKIFIHFIKIWNFYALC